MIFTNFCSVSLLYLLPPVQEHKKVSKTVALMLSYQLQYCPHTVSATEQQTFSYIILFSETFLVIVFQKHVLHSKWFVWCQIQSVSKNLHKKNMQKNLIFMKYFVFSLNTIFGVTTSALFYPLKLFVVGPFLKFVLLVQF